MYLHLQFDRPRVLALITKDALEQLYRKTQIALSTNKILLP